MARLVFLITNALVAGLEAYYQSLVGEHPKARRAITTSVPTQEACGS
jgi:hypothetical protein